MQLEDVGNPNALLQVTPVAPNGISAPWDEHSIGVASGSDNTAMQVVMVVAAPG